MVDQGMDQDGFSTGEWWGCKREAGGVRGRLGGCKREGGWMSGLCACAWLYQYL